MTSKVDWVRAGALTAGTAALLAAWSIGLVDVGWWPRRAGAWVMIASVLASVALGATLGHPRREASVLRGTLLPRMLLAVAVGAVLGAALFGVFFLAFTRIRDHLGLALAVAGAALAAWGLRRLPEPKRARVALLSAVASLVAVRALAAVPGAERRLERRLFPLSAAVVRSKWDYYQCGTPCWQGRARVVDWRIDELAYDFQHEDWLSADVRVVATFEVTKPYVIDGCNDAHDTQPSLAESARGYPTTAACRAAHPLRWHHARPQNAEEYRACCAIGSRQRQPGERFQATGTTRFVFREAYWDVLVVDPRPNTPRPYRRIIVD